MGHGSPGHGRGTDEQGSCRDLASESLLPSRIRALVDDRHVEIGHCTGTGMEQGQGEAEGGHYLVNEADTGLDEN